MAKKRKLPEESTSGLLPNQKQAAAELGISVRALREWQKEPGFPDYSKGYNVAAIKYWREVHQRKGSEVSEDLRKIRLELEQEKLRLARAEREKKERDNEIEKGNILPRDEYEMAFRESIQICRDGLMGLPQELSKLVPQKYQKKLLQEGQALVKKRLAEFSRGVQHGPRD